MSGEVDLGWVHTAVFHAEILSAETAPKKLTFPGGF